MQNDEFNFDSSFGIRRSRLPLFHQAPALNEFVAAGREVAQFLGEDRLFGDGGLFELARHHDVFLPAVPAALDFLLTIADSTQGKAPLPAPARAGCRQLPET